MITVATPTGYITTIACGYRFVSGSRRLSRARALRYLESLL